MAPPHAAAKCGPCPHPSHAAPDARIGAVSFLHRFGSALNPHFHFHVVVLDGLFSEEPDGTVRFDEATHLTGDDAHHLQPLLQRRILRLFQRRGLLDPATVENMLTWQGSGGFSLDASVRIHAPTEAAASACSATAPARPWRWSV